MSETYGQFNLFVSGLVTKLYLHFSSALRELTSLVHLELQVNQKANLSNPTFFSVNLNLTYFLAFLEHKLAPLEFLQSLFFSNGISKFKPKTPTKGSKLLTIESKCSVNMVKLNI